MKIYNFNKLIDTWIEYSHYDMESNEAAERFWAADALMMYSHDNPEELWLIILEILKRDSSPKIMGLLSAGPLEDLLGEHGPLFIDRVEKEATINTKFQELLRGVWKRGMKDEVWSRMQKARQSDQ